MINTKRQWEIVAEITDEMAKKGYWLKLTSPWNPGGKWYAGFTPHDVTGWNGRPDYPGEGDSAFQAVAIARFAALKDVPLDEDDNRTTKLFDDLIKSAEIPVLMVKKKKL